jgi:hypothetical protein
MRRSGLEVLRGELGLVPVSIVPIVLGWMDVGVRDARVGRRGEGGLASPLSSEGQDREHKERKPCAEREPGAVLANRDRVPAHNGVGAHNGVHVGAPGFIPQTRKKRMGC